MARTRHRHDPSKHFVGFLVGDVLYAVRIELVREIVNPLDIVELPRAPMSVKGVADYRGEVVPVVDLRERFGLPDATQTRKNKWIVVDVGRHAAATTSSGKFAALVVDSVTEVFGSGGSDVRPAPPLGDGDFARTIAGVTNHADRLVFVLDVRAFGAAADAALRESQMPPGMFP